MGGNKCYWHSAYALLVVRRMAVSMYRSLGYSRVFLGNSVPGDAVSC
jgi:hypothetical protein